MRCRYSSSKKVMVRRKITLPVRVDPVNGRRCVIMSPCALSVAATPPSSSESNVLSPSPSASHPTNKLRNFRVLEPQLGHADRSSAPPTSVPIPYINEASCTPWREDGELSFSNREINADSCSTLQSFTDSAVDLQTK